MKPPVCGVAMTKATAAGQAVWHRLAHHRGVEYVPTMIDIDGKPFAAALLGVVTLATGYVAEVTDWALLALPPSVMVGHYLAFRSPAEPATPGRRVPVRATEPIAALGVGGLPRPSGAVPAAFYPDRPAA